MKISNSITIVFEDAVSAASAISALKHEEDFKKRSISSVRVEKNVIIINVKGEDIVAVRAAVNAYLRDLQVFGGINNIE